MSRILKYKKYDDFGDLIIESSQRWYIAEIQNGASKGDRVKRYKEGYQPKSKSKISYNTSNLTGHKNFQSNGFDKRPQDAKAGNRASLVANSKENKMKLREQIETDVLWTINQRECLRRLLQMTFHELVAYYVKWNMGSVSDVLGLYGEDVSKTIDQLPGTPPTTIQILSLRMVLRARDDAKLAMNIMEMIEGKAVNQKVNAELELQEKKVEEEETKKETFSPVNTEMTEMLALMKEIAFTKEEVMADWESKVGGGIE